MNLLPNCRKIAADVTQIQKNGRKLPKSAGIKLLSFFHQNQDKTSNKMKVSDFYLIISEQMRVLAARRISALS